MFDDATSIQRLNNFFVKLKAVNVGTVTSFERNNCTFQRAFPALGVAGMAFPSLLPAVIIDACHMKTKQGGIIFAATGVTGDKKNFPLAIAIGPTENEDNWLWFLDQLKKAILHINSRNVVITSDRDKGSKAALKQAVPMATTCICREHLKRNVEAKFNIGSFRDVIRAAAKACTIEEYECHMAIIRNTKDIGEEVFQYLDMCKEEWVNAFVPVPRYDILTSNSAESMNSTLEKLRDGGYLRIFTKFTKRCAKFLYERHVYYSSLDADLPVSVQEKWSRVQKQGKTRRWFKQVLISLS